jgi:hypothetical protein
MKAESSAQLLLRDSIVRQAGRMVAARLDLRDVCGSARLYSPHMIIVRTFPRDVLVRCNAMHTVLAVWAKCKVRAII